MPNSCLKVVFPPYRPQDQTALGRRVGLLVDLSNHQCLYSEDLKPEMGLSYRHFQFVAKRLPDPASCRMVRAKKAKGGARTASHTIVVPMQGGSWSSCSSAVGGCGSCIYVSVLLVCVVWCGVGERVHQ